MGSMTGRSAIATIAITTSMTLLSLSGLQAQGVVPMEPSAQTNAFADNSEIASPSTDSPREAEPGSSPTKPADKDKTTPKTDITEPEPAKPARESDNDSPTEKENDQDTTQTSQPKNRMNLQSLRNQVLKTKISLTPSP